LIRNDHNPLLRVVEVRGEKEVRLTGSSRHRA
jgi:hypothetical protein